MKNKLLAATSALLLLSAIQSGALQGSGSAGAADKNQPDKPNSQTSGDQAKNPDPSAAKTVTPTPTPTPAITDTEPAAPTLFCNAQKVKVSGTGFQKDVTVTLIAPDGRKSTLSGTDVTWIGDKEVQISPTLSTTGTWKVSVTNPDKTSSAEFSFNVIDSRSPSVQAYDRVFWVITWVLLVLAVAIMTGLIVAWATGSWSLGTALSEEAAVQPQLIRSLDDVIMVGSTSRLIALVGLMGILVMVLGIGYSIIWNLFVAGRSPDLSSVKSFLFGAASLFAPYLANQVRAAFDQASAPAPTPAPTTGSPPTMAITGVPGTLKSGGVPQQLTVTGSGFDSGAVITLIDPGGQQTTLQTNDIVAIHPTLLVANVPLNAPGTWRLKIAGSGGRQSVMKDFVVYGTPLINGVPTVIPAPGGAAVLATREITLTGRGFLQGCTATVVPVAGGAPIATTVKSQTYTQLVLTATMVPTNGVQVTVTNSGGFTATSPSFNV
jgi:hypothetical protein